MKEIWVITKTRQSSNTGEILSCKIFSAHPSKDDAYFFLVYDNFVENEIFYKENTRHDCFNQKYCIVAL